MKGESIDLCETSNWMTHHDLSFSLAFSCSAGSSVMAAYVEIIFDNSDGRFSVDSDEVVLRRTVG